MAISIITIDGESYDVGASAGNVAFNNSGTGISAGTVQGAIEEISATGGEGGGYEPPVGGIPYKDLAQTVRDSLDKADTALQSESDPVFAASAAHGITSTDINNWNNKASSADIPTKTSELTNDSGFVTDEDIEDFVTADDIEEIVMGSADVSVVEAQGYINIVFAEANITVSEDNLVLTEASPNGTFNVSGSHLKDDITVTAPTGFKVQLAGGTPQFAVTIPHVNGTVESTTVTVNATPTSVSDVLQGNVELESGAVSASVGVYYSQYAGPTILADNTLTIKAAAGQSDTESLQVTGLNLTAGITATVSGTGFTVSTSENGTYGSTASLPSSGGTLYVKFSPTGSTGSTGTLTLSSTGATSKTVTLTGAVASITTSVDSLSLSATEGSSTTGTFTVRGSGLSGDLSISASDTGFSVSPATIAKTTAEGSAQTVTVTYAPSAYGSHTGSITISDGVITKTVTLSGTAVAIPSVDSNNKFTADGIKYEVQLSDGALTDNVSVIANNYSGNVTIPSTVVAKLNGAATQFNVTKIATNAFYENNSHVLTGLALPSSIISVGANFCYNCTNLAYVDMGCAQNPNFATKFGGNNSPNFVNCSSLTSIVIPDAVEDWETNNFQGCSGLRSITLGKNLKEFRRLFDTGYAPGVTEIICRGKKNNPRIPHINAGSTTFQISSTTYTNAVVKVPTGEKQNYLDEPDTALSTGTKFWANFTNEIQEYTLTD